MIRPDVQPPGAGGHRAGNRNGFGEHGGNVARTAHGGNLEHLRQALATNAERVALGILGEPSSRTAHELRWGRRGSLALTIAGERRGLFFDHERGTGGDLLDLVMRERRCSFADAAVGARDLVGLDAAPGGATTPRQRHAAPMPPRRDEGQEREARAKAAAVWGRAEPITEADDVGRYLLARGCRLPNPDGDLRRLPATPPRYPLATMVARVTLFDDPDHGLTLHFTPVRPDGTRGDRHLMAGLRSKGVIRVDPDDRVTGGLFVAEGIESALSLPPPAWATVSAGTLAGLPVLDGVEALTIAVDADDAGQRAAERCAATWHEAGREVRIFDLAKIQAGRANGL